MIVSTSTLEHIDDPERALKQMAGVLRPGGRMIHAIAMGNHCCGKGQADALGHLYYPEWLWSAMFSNRVGHNRLRWFEWEDLFLRTGFKLDYQTCANIEKYKIDAARPFLASRFKNMSDQQLSPSYAVICCTKQ